MFSWRNKKNMDTFGLKKASYQDILKCKYAILSGTLQPLYNTICYNTVLDITWFKDGSQKCIDYIEK